MALLRRSFTSCAACVSLVPVIAVLISLDGRLSTFIRLLQLSQAEQLLTASAKEKNTFIWDQDLVTWELATHFSQHSQDLTQLSDNQIHEFQSAVNRALYRTYLEARRASPEWQLKVSMWNNFVEQQGLEQLWHQRRCQYRQDWLGLLEPLVVPRLKLGFCYIPKVACTAFKDLINTLNELNVSVGFATSYLVSTPSELSVSRSDMTHENGWKFAAFTRDPLERYLSAFGSTCVQRSNGKTDHPMECCGAISTKNASMEELVTLFELRAFADDKGGLPWEEQHWASQVQVLFNCGWDLFAPSNLDFRGHMGASNMNQQVKDMLRVVNASEDDLRLVDRFFPEHRNATPPELENRNPITWNKANFYGSRRLRKRVKKIYSADYALIPDVGKDSSVEADPPTRD